MTNEPATKPDNDKHLRQRNKHGAELIAQFRVDVIRGLATEKQYIAYLAANADREAPADLTKAAQHFTQWRRYVEAGGTYGS